MQNTISKKVDQNKEEPLITVKYDLGCKTAGYGFHFYENMSPNGTNIIEGMEYTK
jgi:hypothetical protein